MNYSTISFDAAHYGLRNAGHLYRNGSDHPLHRHFEPADAQKKNSAE